MVEQRSFVTLGATDPARLAAALRAVATEDRAQAQWLCGAAQSTADGAQDAAARRFVALLEMAFLVASADGLDDAERSMLAALLESVTGNVIDRAAYEQHFVDLAAATAMLGRAERLGRVAAELEDVAAREEGMAFAALIAMADGRLETVEYDALVELGGHLGMSPERVRGLVTEVSDEVAARLARAGGGA